MEIENNIQNQNIETNLLEKKQSNKKITIFAIIVILIAGLGYFVFNYLSKDSDNNISDLEIYLKENYSKYVIDGSTSLIPLHEALEAKFGTGKEIKHTKTVDAFNNFVDGNIDILLAVDYLDSYFEKAISKNIEITKKEITKEALVFLRNIEFEQDSLTVDQIKKIFNKEITYWKEIDKKHVDELNPDYPPRIQPIYRNADSGSGMAMLKLLEKNSVNCHEDECVFISDMGGVINALAYGLEEMWGSQLIAFNMYTFSEKQYHNEKVKTFKINGIEPNDETIYSDEYPIVLYNYVYYKNDKAKEFGEKLYEYLISDAGQKLIMENGYVPLKKQKNASSKDNSRNCKDNFVDEVCVKKEGYNEEINKYVKISIDNELEKYEYFDTVEAYIFANSNISEEERADLSDFLGEVISEAKKENAITEKITFKKQEEGNFLFNTGDCGGTACIWLEVSDNYDFGVTFDDNNFNAYHELLISKDLKNISNKKASDNLQFSIPVSDFSRAFKFLDGKA